MADRIAPDPRNMAIPPIESPFLEELLAESSLTEETKAYVRHFAENGYAVIDLGLDDFDTLSERLIRDLAPRYPEGNDRRIDEAWYFNDDVRTVATAPNVLEALRLLYQREPYPFQTLNFDVGTEQPAHSDTIHFHCVPHHYMVGVWVPFEDIQPGSGELFVVPGSHRIHDFEMFDLGLRSDTESYGQYEEMVAQILKAEGLERVSILPKRGQAVIWVANLFHGGCPVTDPSLTRHSQATHYYFSDCMYYMPLESDPFGGKMTMREVIDITTGKFVPHRYRGKPVDLSSYESVFEYARPLPDWVDVPTESKRGDGGSPTERGRAPTPEETLEHLREENRRKDQRIASLDRQLQTIRGSKTYRLVNSARDVVGRVLGRPPNANR